MNIAIINGSPKGRESITLQTMLYVKKRYPFHNFDVIDAGQKIKQMEKDFNSAKEILENAQLIIFAYPVYTFIAPYQMHRFIELFKESGIDVRGKYATQFTTSKHFYDVTAHNYIEENCYDLGLRYIRGLSADMNDLLYKSGQNNAEMFWEQLIFSVENNIYESKPPKKTSVKKAYKASFEQSAKKDGVDVVIVTNFAEDDINLQNMIADFRAVFPYHTRIINIREFKFSGGCLGCMSCAVNGKCIYKDGFDDFLRNEIQITDALVYAFTIKNHYTEASFKLYDDRQFCNGHRTVTMGIPVGYLISGDYENEPNLKTIVEARSEVGGNFLSYVATDERDTANKIKNLSKSLAYAYENKLFRPKNFYGVGGTKIFRDLIYVMRGIMKADHKFYKKHGIYDFPQKQRITILKMQLAGIVMSIPSVQKKLRRKMNELIQMPYKKIINAAKAKDEI